MLGLIRTLLKGDGFIRGVIFLVGGASGAQIIFFLASPIITRIYSPEEFGVLSFFVAIFAVCGVVSSLRYELAIPIASSDVDAVNLLVLSFICLLGITALMVAITILLSIQGLRVEGYSQMYSYLWFLPIGVFFIGLHQILVNWGLRRKAFGRIAGTRIKQSVSTVASQIGFHKFGVTALVAGYIGGLAVASFALGGAILKSKDLQYYRWNRVLNVARRHKRFAYIDIWAALFNTAGVQMPPILFALLFSPAVAGVYALAHRVLALPAALIGEAVGKVFFANAADARRKGDISFLVLNLNKSLAYLAMPPALIIITAGPYLFDFIFGAGWGVSGKYAQWMMPWLYLVFLASPLSSLFLINERQKDGLVFQSILLVCRLVSLLVGAGYEDASLAIFLFSVSSAICWIGFVKWVSYSIGVSFVKLVSPILTSLFWSVLAILPLGVVCNFPVSLGMFLVGFFLTIIFVSVYYYFFLKWAFFQLRAGVK
ncbi:lipopolysaccharide biosynthesis protein [Halopseudomonas sp.]|uniref:lipopolysaccharide biosynthesis protein n=1 Tax=Halopseudomonas sp. TaxID=2901191 RepID=UPI00311E11F8